MKVILVQLHGVGEQGRVWVRSKQAAHIKALSARASFRALFRDLCPRRRDQRGVRHCHYMSRASPAPAARARARSAALAGATYAAAHAPADCDFDRGSAYSFRIGTAAAPDNERDAPSGTAALA